MPTWAKLVALALLVLLASVGLLHSSFVQNGDIAKPNLVETDANEVDARKPVADFALTGLDGAVKHLSDYRGQVVLLSFWASWCGPCLEELPTFAELQSKLNGRGFVVLPINLDDGDEGKTFSKEFWVKKKLPFSSFFDGKKEIAAQFEVDMLPSNFVLDRQGRLVFSGVGATDWMKAETLEMIEGLLAESATASN